jgi:hypothetical protein
MQISEGGEFQVGGSKVIPVKGSMQVFLSATEKGLDRRLQKMDEGLCLAW